MTIGIDNVCILKISIIILQVVFLSLIAVVFFVSFESIVVMILTFSRGLVLKLQNHADARNVQNAKMQV